MKIKYLIRLDDACPYMDRAKWQRMEDILDKYSVKPLVGIIPANADSGTMIESENPKFWDEVRVWREQKCWSLALHGYDHVCISTGGLNGLNPMWKRSEFAGLPLEQQREKIRKGYAVLKEHGLEPKYFFAPSHTFDENTLEALRLETNIRIVSDTIGRYPYKKGDFVFIPQISGHCVKMPVSGIYTFCFHPNTMSDGAFIELESFMKSYSRYFTDFSSFDIEMLKEKSLQDKIISSVFFGLRKMRGLK